MFTIFGVAFTIVSLLVAFGGVKYIELSLEESVKELANTRGMAQMDSTAKGYLESMRACDAESRQSLQKIKEVQQQTDDMYKFLPAGSVIASVLTPERFYQFVNKNYWRYADGANLTDAEIRSSQYTRTTGWGQILDLTSIQPKAKTHILYYYIKIN